MVEEEILKKFQTELWESVEKYIDTSGNFSYNGTTIDSQGTTTLGGSTPNASTIFGSGSSTQYNMNVTVTSGGTNTQTISNSTDGSFNLTGTISGNNGSGQPFALHPVNSGSGGVSVSDYSGTLSASAL